MMVSIMIAAAFLVGATVAFDIYLRTSERSFRDAARIWQHVNLNADRVISGPYPDEIREMAMSLAVSAGCGCYVRALLVRHFAPAAFNRTLAERARPEDQALIRAMKALNQAQRRHVDELVSSVVAYDSFVNPLQGLWIRRILKRHVVASVKPQAFPPANRETRETVLKVVASKEHIPANCVAA